MIPDYFRLVLNQLRRRTLRASLTVLGIIIGIAAIIALLSISQGLKSSIEEQFQTFGVDRIIVSPKASQTSAPGTGATTLTTDDITTVEKVPDVSYAAAFLLEILRVEYSRQKISTYVTGLPFDLHKQLIKDYGLKFSEGNYLSSLSSREVIVGHRIATDTFDKSLHINNQLLINDVPFRVVGILESIGNPEDDSVIWISMDNLQEITGNKKSVSMIDVKLNKGSDPIQAAEKIKRRLQQAREDDESFDVLTADQLLSQFNLVLGIVQAVLIGIAFISLVVGAVGITTSMYAAVTERIAEIGIMKAIGATNNQVMSVFLLEAGLLGVFGGVVGVLLGFLAGKGVETIAHQAGFTILTVSLSPGTAIGGVAFAALVALSSGLVPAYQASRLNPVDAMRFG